jgi:trk system potassium uptake protein TrkA
MLKDMGAKMVVSRASREVQARLLKKIGADEIVYPEKQLAHWAAVRFTSDHIQDFIELDDEHGIFEVFVPRQWVGHTLDAMEPRKKYQINMLGYRHNEKLVYNVSLDYVFKEKEAILVLGSYKSLHSVFGI